MDESRSVKPEWQHGGNKNQQTFAFARLQMPRLLTIASCRGRDRFADFTPERRQEFDDGLSTPLLLPTNTGEPGAMLSS